MKSWLKVLIVAAGVWVGTGLECRAQVPYYDETGMGPFYSFPIRGQPYPYSFGFSAWGPERRYYGRPPVEPTGIFGDKNEDAKKAQCDHDSLRP